MSTGILTLLVLVPTTVVVLAMFLVLWRGRTSPREARAAIVTGIVLIGWGVLTVVLAWRGAFVQPDGNSTPPIGIHLLIVAVVLAGSLIGSRSLRRLLTRLPSLIRLNLWRLVGLVFLMLMVTGQMPALWALPAGIGDVIVGSTAWRVARDVESPGGRRRAIFFNLFGMLDLIVAVGLGITTNIGPLHLFHTTPTSALVTHFPLVLVPAFLVPLAFTLHIVSLWQLFGWPWVRE